MAKNGMWRLWMAASVAVGLAACTSVPQGMAVGSAIGAGAGAIIGHEAGHPAAGAVVGAATGAAVGGLVAEATRPHRAHPVACAEPVVAGEPVYVETPVYVAPRVIYPRPAYPPVYVRPVHRPHVWFGIGFPWPGPHVIHPAPALRPPLRPVLPGPPRPAGHGC